MKNKSIYILFLLFSIIGCVKEGEEAVPVESITVNVKYPQNIFNNETSPTYANIVVSLKSVSREYSTITDGNGRAVFNNIIPDTYTFSTSHLLQENELKNLINKPAKGIDVIAKGILPDIQVTYNNLEYDITLDVGKSSDILISKIYFTGTKYSVNGVLKKYGAGNTAYDAYIELFNNGEDSVSTKNMYLASLDTDSSNPFSAQKDNFVFAKDIYKIPDIKIASGKSIVIARMARNHKEVIPPVPSSIDLSTADFETKGIKDAQNPNIPELPYVYHMLPTLDYLHFVTKGGFTYIIFITEENPADWPKQPTKPSKPTLNLHIQIPVESIIDGVDVLTYAASPDRTKKRLPNSIDASYLMLPTEYKDGYGTVSVERRVQKNRDNGTKTLVDLNNSETDFVWVVNNVCPRDYDKSELY